MRAFTVSSHWICADFGFSHGARSTTTCENARSVPDVDLVPIVAQCEGSEASRHLLELYKLNVSISSVATAPKSATYPVVGVATP